MNPLKALLSILCITFACRVVAQKIKIKRDVVRIDKQEVCKIKKVPHQFFEICTLEGKPLFQVQREVQTAVATHEGYQSLLHIRFKKPTSDTLYYAKHNFEGLPFTLNSKKMFIRFLSKKMQFINEKGINYDKINEFFSKSRPKNDRIDNAEQAYKEAYDSIIPKMGMWIEGNRIYRIKEKKYRKNPKDTARYMGHFRIYNDEKSGFYSYSVYDAKRMLTALHQHHYFQFFDGLQLNFALDPYKQPIEHIRKIIDRIMIAGYTLEDMRSTKSRIIRKIRKRKAEKAKETSDNIYNQEAIVYTLQGEKINEGLLTLEFNELLPKKSRFNIHSIGSEAMLVTTRPDSTQQTTFYKARKDAVRIYLKATDSYYRGVRTNGLTATKFNKELMVGGALELYKSMAFGYFILKKRDEDKGLIVSKGALFKEDNTTAVVEQIAAYLEDCPNIKEKLTALALDYAKESEVKKVVELYHQCQE